MSRRSRREDTLKLRQISITLIGVGNKLVGNQLSAMEGEPGQRYSATRSGIYAFQLSRSSVFFSDFEFFVKFRRRRIGVWHENKIITKIIIYISVKWHTLVEDRGLRIRYRLTDHHKTYAYSPKIIGVMLFSRPLKDIFKLLKLLCKWKKNDFEEMTLNHLGRKTKPGGPWLLLIIYP